MQMPNTPRKFHFPDELPSIEQAEPAARDVDDAQPDAEQDGGKGATGEDQPRADEPHASSQPAPAPEGRQKRQPIIFQPKAELKQDPKQDDPESGPGSSRKLRGRPQK